MIEGSNNIPYRPHGEPFDAPIKSLKRRFAFICVSVFVIIFLLFFVCIRSALMAILVNPSDIYLVTIFVSLPLTIIFYNHSIKEFI